MDTAERPPPIHRPETLIPPAPEPAKAELSGFRLLVAYRRNALLTYSKRAFEDDVLPFRPFFGRKSMLLNAPDGIRRVLIDNADNYGRTAATIRILRPMLGDGLLLSEGEAWKHQRRTIAPALAPRAIPALVPLMTTAIDERLSLLAEKEKNKEPVHLFQAMQHLALEVAGRTMFSLKMSRHRHALRSLITEYGFRFAQPYLLDFLLPSAIPNLRDLARLWFRRRWFALIDQLIAERLGAPPTAKPRDLFDALLQARDPETGAAFSPQQLRDQVATLIIAGHETTALALFWAVYLLTLAPAWQERIVAEAAGVDLSPNAAAHALSQLVIAKAVIEEALRLYPPAFTIVRLARGDDERVGAPVQKGSVIVISPWVLHRHRRRWRAPDAFDPTRFLPDAPPVDRFAYLPFGAGPRVCIGASFAMAEATLALAKLTRAFRIEPLEAEPVMPVAVITTQPNRSPAFRLSRR